MKVPGKVFVITGAGSGIGRELARQLVVRGARVAAVDHRVEGLENLASAPAARTWLSTHVIDVTNPDAVRALPAEVEAAHGAVDGVVNNAGIIQPFLPVIELDDGAIQRVLEVNLMGTLNMVRAFLPLLIARPEAQVVNVASMGGFFPFPGQTIYGASKAAVKLLSEGLYAELLDTGVRTTVVLPGAVDTGIAANSGIEVPSAGAGPRPMSPEKAARLIIRGIERDKFHIYVGADAKVMNLAIKVAPRTSIRIVQSRMRRYLARHASPGTTA